MPRLSDALEVRLVQQMAIGDEAALGALYDRWRTVVYNVAARITGDPAEAEEVLEDTFWQAWRQADRFESARGSVGTWLLTIARSRALDRARATARRAAVETSAEPRSDESGGGNAEMDGVAADRSDLPAERAEEARLVAQALAELPVEQRETLELAYFGGLSQSEIAERTGLPLGTIKTRVRLAFRKLRERLAVLREGDR